MLPRATTIGERVPPWPPTRGPAATGSWLRPHPVMARPSLFPKPMKLLLRHFPAACWLAAAWLALPAAAQMVQIVQFDQTALLYSATNAASQGSGQQFYYHTNIYQRGVNYRSVRGVPLSNTAGTPAGSDGRAPSAPGTPKQFSGFVAYGAIVRPGGTNLNVSSNYAQNAGAANLDLPRLTNDTGTVLVVLLSLIHI
jgi:hypothetical protein